MDAVILIAGELLTPFQTLEKRVKKPIRLFVRNAFSNYKKKTTDGVNNVREIILKAGVMALITSVIVMISIFMYVAFYYTYMPNIAHSRPVHLQFKPCGEHPGMCSYPSAHVRLTKRQQLLMVGQPYKVALEIDMPESDVNKKLGMFMCCCELRGHTGSLAGASCRSALLPYRSPLMAALAAVSSAPLLLMGLRTESHQLRLEMFSNYEDDPNLPITDVYVEVQSRHIQLYSATLYIEAHFTGLRYLMFHWPVFSATVGVGTNLMFVALVCALSWYHLQLSTGLEEDEDEDEKPTQSSSSRDDSFSMKLEATDESPSSEDASFLDESIGDVEQHEKFLEVKMKENLRARSGASNQTDEPSSSGQ